MRPIKGWFETNPYGMEGNAARPRGRGRAVPEPPLPDMAEASVVCLRVMTVTAGGNEGGMTEGDRFPPPREQRRRVRGNNEGGARMRMKEGKGGSRTAPTREWLICRWFVCEAMTCTGRRGWKGGDNPVPTRGGRERNVDGQPQGLPQRGRAWIGGWIPVPVFTGQAIRGNNGKGAQGRTGMGEECVR